MHLSRLSLLVSFLMVCAGLQAQHHKKITGTVLDETGESIIGASVAVKGSAAGTITDIDGRFALEVEDTDVITVSFIGYLSQELAVAGKSEIRIILKENAEMLDEVVVVGYGVVRKKTLPVP